MEIKLCECFVDRI